MGSADTARARARVRSRQRCARTQARKGIGKPREPSGLAITTTITIARDQQQKVKAPKGEESRIDTQSAQAHPTPEPIRRRVLYAVPVASGNRTPTIRSAEGAAGERIATRHKITQQVTRRCQRYTSTKRVKDVYVFNKMYKNPPAIPTRFVLLYKPTS